MGRIANTWQLAKASASVLNKDRELLVLPILSGVASLIVGGVLLLPLLASGSDTAGGLLALLGIIFVLALTVISVVFQGALVSGAHERFTGGDPTISSAIGGAVSKLHRLVPWAILTATVGLVLRWIREEAGLLGRIVGSLLDMAWEVLTFLVVPVVMFEDRGPIDGVKRSSALFKVTWGENLVARVGFGLLGFAAAIPGIVLIVAGAAGFWPLIIPGVAWIIGVVVVMTALNAVFQTALYLYATTGEVPSGFEQTTLPSAFGEKGS